jgi:hypothetical protein
MVGAKRAFLNKTAALLAELQNEHHLNNVGQDDIFVHADDG